MSRKNKFTRKFPLNINGYPKKLESNTFRILSIDGGGARGMIPAVILKEIERRSGKPICKLFDRVCGTSTGAVIVSALSAPKSEEETRPMFMASEIVEIYRELGKEIFYRGSFTQTVLEPIDKLLNRKVSWIAAHAGEVIDTIDEVWKKLNHPLHDVYKLAYFLYSYFGKLKMEDSLIELFIYAYDVGSRTPQVIGSTQSSIPGSSDYSKYCIYQTVTASSAAAPFFAPYTIWKNPRTPIKKTSGIGIPSNGIGIPPIYPEVKGSGDAYTFIDGGNGGLGNPSLLAVLEETNSSKNRSQLVLSLGTGHFSEPIPSKSKEWGFVQWLGTGELLNNFFDGESDCTDMALRQILDKNVTYFRWQPSIPESLAFMDEGRTEDMNALENVAKAFISEMDEEIDALIELLDR